MTTRRKILILGGVMLALALMIPITAQATAFTWSGTTSNAWNLNTNWGGSGFPNAYTDTATIGTVIANTPVSLSTTALLGVASGNALILSNVAGSATGLDITSTGILGMQGGIGLSSSTTNGRKITIEGILRNDSTSGGTYTIGGGTNAGDIIQLVGGTISSLSTGSNAGIWAFQRPVQGYGTISSPFTNTNTISANVSGQTLHIAGTSTAAGSLTSTGGGILSLESALTGVTLPSGTGTVNLAGATITGMTNNSANQTINLTADSAVGGTISQNQYLYMVLNGHQLNFNVGTYNNVSGGANPAFTVDTGTLNNVSAASTIGSGDGITIAGGTIKNSSTSNIFTIAAPITGYGTLNGGSFANGLTISGGSVKASGGTLTLSGNITSGGIGFNTGTGATDVLNLTGNISGNNFISPASLTQGTVNINGATMNGTGAGMSFGNNSVGGFPINVTSTSILTGAFTNYGNLIINGGVTLNGSGITQFATQPTGTVTVQSGAAPTWGGTFLNAGQYISDLSTNTFTNLTVASTGSIKSLG
jgi:fibronectin-binding autotransporter adhesin